MKDPQTLNIPNRFYLLMMTIDRSTFDLIHVILLYAAKFIYVIYRKKCEKDDLKLMEFLFPFKLFAEQINLQSSVGQFDLWFVNLCRQLVFCCCFHHKFSHMKMINTYICMLEMFKIT